MQKIYYFESDPEPKVWEKMIENKNGKITYETPWMISDGFNGNSQINMSEINQNRMYAGIE